MKQPSEEAMKNLYLFIERVLPKYVAEINAAIEQREGCLNQDQPEHKTA